MSLTHHNLLEKISKDGFSSLEKLAYSKEELEKLFTFLEEKGLLMKVEDKIELTSKSKIILELENERRNGQWISKEVKSQISKVSKNTLYLP
ncbi:hypothetical protein V9L05_16045 [Bernardetia sp. Wsw4-3y2]|uniref:hypothetical protein n=1 Tax=Bernardetia sp. Wsw4-3y2 TaxID=3127471 RepID=UPI0030CE9A6B